MHIYAIYEGASVIIYQTERTTGKTKSESNKATMTRK